MNGEVQLDKKRVHDYYSEFVEYLMEDLSCNKEDVLVKQYGERSGKMSFQKSLYAQPSMLIQKKQ